MAPLVAAVVMLALFLLIESRAGAPMVPLRLFRNRNLSTGACVTSLFTATFGALAFFLTRFWQVAQGYGPWATGLAFVVPSGSVLIGAILGGRSATRIGVRKTLLVSPALGFVGTAAPAFTLSESVSYWALVPPLVVLSVGQNVVSTTMYAAATTAIAPTDQGIGSGIATTGQQIGGAVGLAVLIAVVNTVTTGGTGDPGQLTEGVTTATWGIALGIVLTVMVVLNLKKPAAPEEPAPPAGKPVEVAGTT